jgi:hypothetical protein
MKKINNYRWQQQQKAKLEHQKVKKIKKEVEKLPVSAAEELEYINKLLSGEEVEDFVGENDPPLITKKDFDEARQSVWGTSLVQKMQAQQHALNMAHQSMMASELMRQASDMTLSDYFNQISGEEYYK